MADAPHDALFRFAFTDPAVVRDHWRASFPPEIVAKIRWETLELLPGSFVDEDLKQVHSDVLHRVSLEDGATVWLYVLFEHQSTVDPLMAWRLLRYAVRIWERALAEGGSELPLLVPVVLYTGRRTWTAPTSFDGLFPASSSELRAFVEPHLPRFRYLLQDLSELPDAALRGLVLREAVLLAFKHASDGSVWRLTRCLDVLVAVATVDGLSALEALWRYVLTVAPTPPPPSVRSYLTERLPPEMERLVMGYGEQLMVEARARGREEGREEGREQGRELGVRQGEARVLSMLLERRFGPLPVHVARRIDAATAAELEQWVARVLDAESVDVVIGDPEAG